MEEELRAYDELASDVHRIEIDGEKSIARAARMLEDATSRQPRIQEKLRALVAEIEAARVQQQKSLDTLVGASQALQARATQYGELMDRFAALGEAASGVNALTTALSARRSDGAAEGELLAGLQELEQRMDTVVERADSLAQDAQQHGWPEIARQADAVRQQVHAAKNKLSLAHRAMASRAPS